MFDDFILYCPLRDKIFIGRRDYAKNRIWQWFITDFKHEVLRPEKCHGLIELGREPEMSMFQ